MIHPFNPLFLSTKLMGCSGLVGIFPFFLRLLWVISIAKYGDKRINKECSWNRFPIWVVSGNPLRSIPETNREFISCPFLIRFRGNHEGLPLQDWAFDILNVLDGVANPSSEKLMCLYFVQSSQSKSSRVFCRISNILSLLSWLT